VVARLEVGQGKLPPEEADGARRQLSICLACNSLIEEAFLLDLLCVVNISVKAVEVGVRKPWRQFQN